MGSHGEKSFKGRIKRREGVVESHMERGFLRAQLRGQKEMGDGKKWTRNLRAQEDGRAKGKGGDGREG